MKRTESGNWYLRSEEPARGNGIEDLKSQISVENRYESKLYCK